MTTTRISTRGAYRVEDVDGLVVARYLTDYAGNIVWSVIHHDHPRAHDAVTLDRILELADDGELYAIRIDDAD